MAGSIVRRFRRLPAAVLALLPLLAAPGARALDGQGQEVPLALIQAIPLGDTAVAMLSVPGLPGAEERPAAILLFGDGESAFDGRIELYAQRLLSLGFALLDTDFDGLPTDGVAPAHPPAASMQRRLGLAVAALDDDAPVDRRRLAAIGIGAGARAVLEGWAGNAGTLRAAVLLYPVCDDGLLARAPALRPRPGQGRLLLVHGDADPAEDAGCAALAAALGGAERVVSRYVLRGADVGWDIDPGAVRAAFADPARPGARRPAQPDPDRAAIALDQILLFLMRALGPAQLSSSESQ